MVNPWLSIIQSTQLHRYTLSASLIPLLCARVAGQANLSMAFRSDIECFPLFDQYSYLARRGNGLQDRQVICHREVRTLSLESFLSMFVREQFLHSAVAPALFIPGSAFRKLFVVSVFHPKYPLAAPDVLLSSSAHSLFVPPTRVFFASLERWSPCKVQTSDRLDFMSIMIENNKGRFRITALMRMFLCV